MTESATIALTPSNTDIRRRVDEQIYQSIRDAVLTQKLPPGTRLPESAIGEIFGVSRSVVRKALMHLASDRIIDMRRNQISRVIQPSEAETAEIFDARRLIEAEVTRQVAGTLSREAAETLRGIVEEEARAHEQAAHERRIHLSLDFHHHLANQAPNQVLARMLRELILRTSVAVALYKRAGISACYRHGDHGGIAEALIRGDGEAAARLAVAHLDYLREQLRLGDGERPVDLASILRG